MPRSPVSICWAVVLAALCAAGCHRETEEITAYDAPRDPPRGVRLLGAVITRPDATWFFKLTGPNALVSAQIPNFEALVKSVKFPGNPEVDFQLPQGWTREPGNASRFATLRVPTESKTLDLSITKLPSSAGGLLANVNRWRNQIVLDPLNDEQLNEVARKVPTADGNTAVVVDMLGPRMREMPQMGAAPGAPPPPAGESAAPASTDITYELPPGWQEVPPRDSRITLKAFRVTEGGQSTDLTVTMLAGEAGGILSNVNRWRGQVGLPPMTRPDELISASTEVTVGGARGVMVDFTGSGPAPHVIGAIVLRPGATWFFKMTGPVDLVGRQKSALEAFLKTVRFGGEEKGHP